MTSPCYLCYIRLDYSQIRNAPFFLKMNNNNLLLKKLSQNLLEILNDEEYYDITIEVGNDPHVKVFRAHMVILNYRSPYLRKILLTNKKENDGTLTHIKLPNILPEIFQIILRLVYCMLILLYLNIISIFFVYKFIIYFIVDIFMGVRFLWKNMIFRISLKFLLPPMN